MYFLKAWMFFLVLAVQSCTIYQSPERKTFESESPTFKIQSLQRISCSSESVQNQAQQSRLVTIFSEVSLWEHLIENNSVYESNELNKEYCLYDISK